MKTPTMNQQTHRRVLITKAIAASQAPYIEIDFETMTPRFITDIDWMTKKDKARLMRVGRVNVIRK